MDDHIRADHYAIFLKWIQHPTTQKELKAVGTKPVRISVIKKNLSPPVKRKLF